MMVCVTKVSPKIAKQTPFQPDGLNEVNHGGQFISKCGSSVLKTLLAHFSSWFENIKTNSVD